MKLLSVPEGPAMTDKRRWITAAVVGLSLLFIFGWQADLPFSFQLQTAVRLSMTAPELWLPPAGAAAWKPCVKKKEDQPSE
jgi:hypothetical protein